MFLNNLTLFLRIVEMDGLAVAGREFGLSPATVSERLSSLETYYGARLLTRTTRSISLTDEGRLLIEGAKRILAEAEEVEARIKLGMETLSGLIRISAPVDLGRNRIAPLLNRFMEQHPDIKIDLILNDGYVDLVAQGVDLAIRQGDLADSTLRSILLGQNRRIVCASPKYLEAFGTPEHPDELVKHNCIVMRFGNVIDNEWKYQIEGRLKVVRVKGDRIVNEGDLVRQWCRSGYGLALKSIWDVDEDLRSGALVPILEKFAVPATRLQLVYPSGATQPRRVKMLVEEFVSWFSKSATGH